MRPISSLPEEVFQSLKDLKEYEISRFGITKRYQILIFPFINDDLFLSEFLGYFLKNSCFNKSSQDAYFPFYLISFQIAAYCPGIYDEEDCSFVYSNYLKNPHELQRQIKAKNIKRCIYMLFDTYVGEGLHILGDVVLDVKMLGNVLSEKCIEKMREKKLYGLDNEATLKQFSFNHLKSMKLALKFFLETTTFHPISLSINEQIKEKNKYNHEISLVFFKIFPNQKVSDSLKDQKQESILSNLLRRCFKKGMDLIGTKTVCFTPETFQEFIQAFEKSKFFENNKTFQIIAFSGHDAIKSTFLLNFEN